MRSSRRIRAESVDSSHVVPHSEDIIEVNPLAMIVWSSNRESSIPFTSQRSNLSADFDMVIASDLSKSLVVYTGFNHAALILLGVVWLMICCVLLILLIRLCMLNRLCLKRNMMLCMIL